MKRTAGCILAIVCLLAVFTGASVSFLPSGENIDRVEFNEPSGIVFHQERGTLFAVGDEGDICEIRTDGTLIKQKHIRNLDLEGITYNRQTGMLYVAVEGADKIMEIDPEDFLVMREFVIERTFEGSEILAQGGDGIEGVTFAANPEHPEGGTFFVTNQSFTLEDKDNPSVICEVEVPLKSNRSRLAKIIRCFYPKVVDLADISYDSASGNLFVISDQNNVIFEINRQGEVLSSYDLPGKDQEGIAFDLDGFFYVAQDTGGIIKYKWSEISGTGE